MPLLSWHLKTNDMLGGLKVNRKYYSNLSGFPSSGGILEMIIGLFDQIIYCIKSQWTRRYKAHTKMAFVW